MSQPSFTPGTAVEVNLEVDNRLDVWYPGTVSKALGEGSFLVKYESSKKFGRHDEVVVNSLQIRPCPPSCNNKAFQLLEKVEAFFNSGWSSGIVTKLLSEGRYIVFFKHTRKEKELCHTDLRLPMLWIDGKWVLASQDGSVISNSKEATVVCNTYDNGKFSVPPDIPTIVKETRKLSIKGREDQAVPSENLPLDGINMSTKRIKRATEGNVTRSRVSKSLSKEATPEAKLSVEVCRSMMPPVEGSTDKIGSGFEISTSVVKETVCSKASENTNVTCSASASLEDKVELPTNKKSLAKKRRGWPKGKLRGTLKASSKTQKVPVVNEALLDPFGNSVVISLPCNCLSNSLRDGTPQPPEEETKKVLREGKEQLHASVEHGHMESRDVKNEVIPPKRRRGRPFGSSKRSGEAKNPNEEQMQLPTSGRRRRNLRCPVKYAGISQCEAVVMDFGTRTYISSRGRRVRTTMDILSTIQELQAPLGEKAEVALTNGVAKDADTRQDGISNYVSDDDRPLSTWCLEAHSTPAIEHPIVEFSPVRDASQKGEIVERNYQVSQSAHQLSKVTSVTERDVHAVENVDCCVSNTREKETEIVENSTTSELPFSKSSPVWKTIESMAVFKQLPQKPHFHPLYNCKEHCREGLAIGSMVTFAGLVEKIPMFQVDVPKTFLEGSMETLIDLERQGFDVEATRGRLSSLLEIKNKHEQAWNQSKEIETLITERDKEKAKLNAEVNEIDQKLAELREKRAFALLEKKRKKSEIVGLKSSMEAMKECFEGARSEFERVTTAPW